MSKPNVNVMLGPLNENYERLYKTVILKPNLSFSELITEENTKYVILWKFNLNEETVTIPRNCILEFDGGSLNNGSIIGDETLINNVGDVEIFGRNLNKLGTWRHKHIDAIYIIDNRLNHNQQDINESIYNSLRSIIGEGGGGGIDPATYNNGVIDNIDEVTNFLGGVGENLTLTNIITNVVNQASDELDRTVGDLVGNTDYSDVTSNN